MIALHIIPTLFLSLCLSLPIPFSLCLPLSLFASLYSTSLSVSPPISFSLPVSLVEKTLDVGTRAGADIEERLTLVEASVRVLPAVDPAAGSAMLMALLSPLMHVLAQGLQSTSPDETAVRKSGKGGGFC